MYGEPQASFAISIALFCSISASLLMGLFVPYLFNKLRIDPANASGPVGTIIQDVSTVVIYFWVATLFI